MDLVFAWIEDGALGTWIRESTSIFGFPAIVVLHTLGMGFLAGTNAAIDLRILGIARRIPLASMAKFLPVLWIALAVNVATGVLLVIAYPTKALTNPVFYLKLALIALGLVILQMIRNEVLCHPDTDQHRLGRRATTLAAASLLVWIAAITAGRLLAYTHTWEMLGIPAIS